MKGARAGQINHTGSGSPEDDGVGRQKVGAARVLLVGEKSRQPMSFVPPSSPLPSARPLSSSSPQPPSLPDVSSSLGHPRSKTHDPPEARVRIVSRLVHPLLLGDLVRGVDETAWTGRLALHVALLVVCIVRPGLRGKSPGSDGLAAPIAWSGVAEGLWCLGIVAYPILSEWSGDAVGGVAGVLARARWW